MYELVRTSSKVVDMGAWMQCVCENTHTHRWVYSPCKHTGLSVSQQIDIFMLDLSQACQSHVRPVSAHSDEKVTNLWAVLGSSATEDGIYLVGFFWVDGFFQKGVFMYHFNKF